MAPAPAPAPATHVEDVAGGAARSQSNMAVVKSEDVCTDVSKNGGGGAILVSCSSPAAGDRPVVDPESSKEEGGDTTECSSSFGDTCSGFAEEAGGGEPEVNSCISAHAKPPRKKKVTAEWRNAVRPILWRCQWLELRMKDLSSQVSKYDRELALIKKQKELQQVVSKSDGSVSESLQIHKGHGNISMKRRKRKRPEEKFDTSLYINKHQILSYYYDKQNKGAEADGHLIDDDCSNPGGGSIRGGLDTATLLEAEEHDMIFEQLTLKDILLTIDGVQSQVNLLQDRLSKACSEGENLAFSDDNTHVRVARKRQCTQKRSFSYTKSRYTKPQKRKNLNILLKDDDGPTFAVRPASDRGTNGLIKIANGNAEERSEEWNYFREKAITSDLLFGADNSLANGHMGDLFKENTDDVLIDNEAANEGCQEVDQLPCETSPKGRSTSALVEVMNTSVPVKAESACLSPKVDNISAPVVKQESFSVKSPMMKGRSKKKKRATGSASSRNQSKVASETPAAKQKPGNAPSASKEETGNAPSASKLKTGNTTSASKVKSANTPALKEKTESTSATEEPESMTTRAAGKKSLAAKKRITGHSSLSSSAEKQQETGKSSSASKKQRTENSSSVAKKQETESSTSSEKQQETENSPLAVLVAVNSRRSQRVRKPKVFAA